MRRLNKLVFSRDSYSGFCTIAFEQCFSVIQNIIFQVASAKRIELFCIAEVFVSVAKAFLIFDYKDSRKVTLVYVAKILISLFKRKKKSITFIYVIGKFIPT